MKITHNKCLSIGENAHNSRCPCKPCENSLIYSLYLFLEGFEEDIQPLRDRVDNARG